MSRSERAGRAVAWAVLATLAVALAHRGFGPGADVAALRAREAALCRRFDELGAAILAKADRAGCAADAGTAGARADGDEGPSDTPAALAVIEELRRVRFAIARAEDAWW